MNPFDYSLCRQTVTVYRQTDGEVRRQVVENCCLHHSCGAATEKYGKSRWKKFLLIIPGDVPLEPGDRIFQGIGPQEVQWQSFVPGLVPGVYEVGYAKPCCWDGAVVHWEAGSGKENL